MNDILEDQKIHYIVKDYRRMFDQHQTMIKSLKDYEKLLHTRDVKIRELERQVEYLKDNPPVPKPSGQVKSLFNDVEAQLNSTINNLDKRIEQLNKMAENIQKLREVINQ